MNAQQVHGEIDRLLHRLGDIQVLEDDLELTRRSFADEKAEVKAAIASNRRLLGKLAAQPPMAQTAPVAPAEPVVAEKPALRAVLAEEAARVSKGEK
jgi:hypothetical protein